MSTLNKIYCSSNHFFYFCQKISLLDRKAIILALIILLSLASCRALRKPVAAPVTLSGSATEYINQYSELAVSEMKRTGVPASITLAQGMLESDYGRSTLARMGNNHFGIKCHNGWTGPTIRQHDDRRNECFRKYRNPGESFRDHSDFLRNGARYSFLFSLDPYDYKSWARGLKKAGYATDPRYAELLIKKIDEYGLYSFDNNKMSGNQRQRGKTNENARVSTATSSTPAKSVSKPDPKVVSNNPLSTTPTSPSDPPPSKPTVKPTVKEAEISFGDVMARVSGMEENNKFQYIVVKEGDTKEKIEKEYSLQSWELASYNELNENFKLYPGQILYLQAKREKAEAGKEYHITEQGETIYLISQKYCIKLKNLLEMNRMEKGSEPVVGQKIWLRSFKPVD